MPQRVAYGCSKLFYLYQTYTRDHDFTFIVDKAYSDKKFCGINVITPEEFLIRRDDNMHVYVFAVSNSALNSILSLLANQGFTFGQNVSLYSELFAPSFERALEADLGWKADRRLLQFATAYTLNSRKPIHTTLCGTWLFLEAIERAKAIPGDIAEVGAFEGGNVLCALQSPVWPKNKNYYILDSFEGFPDLSAVDPRNFRQGDYHPEHTLEEILIPFCMYPQARIIKGFVPATFADLPAHGQYSLVFYDCDLYQPAVDTFEYFWGRLAPGGMMLVHDYFAQPGGFVGVKSATDSFFAKEVCRQAKFWQNTIAMFVKP
jgi:hypothetical protein